MKKKVMFIVLGVIGGLGLLVGEPFARHAQTASAISAWDTEWHDGAMWCEGCCSRPTYTCCVLEAACRHIIEET